MSDVQPGTFVAAQGGSFRYVEKSNPHTSNLQWLSYGVYELHGSAHSGLLAHPAEEALLFCRKGPARVTLQGKDYALATYDVLYIPRGAQYELSQDAGDSAVIICRALAEHTHPPFYARWSEFSRDERRIRHLKGKDVFLMFDVTEAADKLVAGYTFYEAQTRAWPPHNHTDQEETYIFIKGHGSMEVYETPEAMTFVHNVREGDLVTIPFLNYHPVFSQEDPLEFIWCIAGERYWVGDKNKDFMAGKGDSITT